MRGSANLTDDQLIDEVARACDESSPFSKASRGAALMRIAPELASRLKAANERLGQAERALKIAGVPIGVGLIGDRPLTNAEKAGARKYEAKARQLSEGSHD